MSRSWRSPRTRTRVHQDRRRLIQEKIIEDECKLLISQWHQEMELAADPLDREPITIQGESSEGAEGEGE